MMRAANSPDPTRLAAALLLTFTLSLGIIFIDRSALVRTASAAETLREKVGDDLRRRVAEKPGDEAVDVIVQPKSSWNTSLDVDLKARGAAVNPPFRQLQTRVVKMRLKDVSTTALRGDVYTQALLALTAGDDTQSMKVTLDGAPTNVKAAAASKTQINLTWTDNATNETGYRVERSTNGTTFNVLATLGAGATSYANAGLTANTRYYYRVQAFNSRAATKYSNTVNALTPRK